MDDIYIFHGRFQPFHMGHIESLKYIAKYCKGKVVIGIVNPNPQNIDRYDDINFSNFDLSRNPLNYWERYYCIKLSIKEYNLEDLVIGIVPMPRLSINCNNSENYLPNKPRFICLYDKRLDDREKIKEEVYKKNGENIFRIPINTFDIIYQMISGKLVRSLIAIDHPLWEVLMPSSTIDFLYSINLSGKIKSMVSEDVAKKQLEEVIARERQYAVKEVIYDILENYIKNKDIIHKAYHNNINKEEYTRKVINVSNYFAYQVGAMGDNAKSDNNIFQNTSDSELLKQIQNLLITNNAPNDVIQDIEVVNIDDKKESKLNKIKDFFMKNGINIGITLIDELIRRL